MAGEWQVNVTWVTKPTLVGRRTVGLGRVTDRTVASTGLNNRLYSLHDSFDRLRPDSGAIAQLGERIVANDGVLHASLVFTAENEHLRSKTVQKILGSPEELPHNCSGVCTPLERLVDLRQVVGCRFSSISCPRACCGAAADRRNSCQTFGRCASPRSPERSCAQSAALSCTSLVA
jgi:hypothetical protein